MSKEIEQAVLEEAGIPTENMLQGLLMSIESNNNSTEERIDQAYKDWVRYYEDPCATNFNCIICHLICKADSDNLFRLSKGFPEHVRIYVENQLLKNVPKEKMTQFNDEVEDE